MDNGEQQDVKTQDRREFLTKVAITAPAVALLVAASAKKAQAVQVYSDFSDLGPA